MKAFTPLLCSLLALFTLMLPMNTVAQTVERSFDVEAGNRLTLDLNTGGSITIKGWDRNTVTVKADLRGRDAEDIDLEIEAVRGGVQVDAEYRNERRRRQSGIDFEIMVPARFDVMLETMGGDVTIANVEGRFEGQTMGGALDLQGLKGHAELKTMGGSILVADAELDGKVETMGGEVRVENVRGDLDASTMGGQVRYTNYRRDANSRTTGDAVRISTMGGQIKVDTAPFGAHLTTMGGRITVQEAAKYVKASTMGGNITIDAIDGWVEASTMGGDIEVRMVGDASTGDRHLELTSMGGDIEVTVPPGLSMDIDLELSYTRRNRDRYRILSDFNVTLDESEDWHYNDGDARKTIYATGRTGNGAHRVKVKTVNGNIYLREANR